MHGWSRSRKRLLLAVMLLPAALLLVGICAVGVVFADGESAPDAIMLGYYCFLAAFGLAFLNALLCLADAVVDRRVEPRAPWAVALLLAPAVASAAYWWLHVRPEPGKPHGLPTLRPAWSWSRQAKGLSGAGALLALVLMVGWMAWMAAFFFDDSAQAVAVPAFASFGVCTVAACAVLTLFVLDALREGGTHAALWVTLLAFAWPLAAPLYWLLYVRPTAPPGGGP